MDPNKRCLFLKSSAVFLGALLFARMAPAQSLEIGVGVSSGSGCPPGSVSYTISPDNAAISLLFSAYNLSLGGSSSDKMGRIACDLRIPIQVPEGIQIAVAGLDYRGYVMLPKTGNMVFLTKDGFLIDGTHFEDSSNGNQEYKGPLDAVFILSRKKKELKWTTCGGRIDLSLHSSVQLKTNEKRDEAMMNIDSADLGLGIVYRLAVRPCEHGRH